MAELCKRSIVLKIAAGTAIENNIIVIDPKSLFSTTDIPLSELEDALEILEQQGYVKLIRHLGPGPYRFCITLYGMDQYARTYIPEYSKIVNDVVVCIVNKKLTDNKSITNELHQPVRLVNHVLDLLENNCQLKLSKYISGEVRIYNVAVSLRRALR